MKFKDMNLSKPTLSALDSLNFFEPTEVQAQTIPLLLNGEELIVRSQTGTGKTAAFGIALIEQVIADKKRKGLVLAPTRELAIQITKDLRAIGINHGIRVYAVYGGDSIHQQIGVLRKGFDIVVATPGRLLDHSKRGTINLSHFSVIVLDEADRMLDMGFRDDLNLILGSVSKVRQLMLFSATVDSGIQKIARTYMSNPSLVQVGDQVKVENTEEIMIKLNRREKFDALTKILHQEPESRTIIFVSTKKSAEYLTQKLYESHVKAQYLHGGLVQNKRERIVRNFSEGAFRILIATDVASRGLHIEDVAHIINYDEARDPETHLHRIGRTGRMGAKGKATTFIELDKLPERNFSRGGRGFSRGRSFSRNQGSSHSRDSRSGGYGSRGSHSSGSSSSGSHRPSHGRGKPFGEKRQYNR
ncbi:MAG: DEAD/DEAH box helicase [Candidatus Diapherotrites archaeon]|nr:DEAD/DEAH box helicase [Candidatus Diapherotrites archaeon]